MIMAQYEYGNTPYDRNSQRKKTELHWAVWLASALGIGMFAFLAIPALTGRKGSGFSAQDQTAPVSSQLIAIKCSLSGYKHTFRIDEPKKAASREDLFIINASKSLLFDSDYKPIKARFTEDSIFPFAGEDYTDVNPVDGRGSTTEAAYKINRQTLSAEYLDMLTQNLTDLGPVKTATNLTGSCRKTDLPKKEVYDQSKNQI